MDCSLDNLPNSGEFPCVYMEIVLKGEVIGKISIRLFRDVFPAGVENFVKIAAGTTYKKQRKGIGNYKYIKNIQRTYADCKFYDYSFNNYIVTGDIYSNNGSDAGTIFNDQSIPPLFGDYFYPHSSKGLISLVPYIDNNGNNWYDSTFCITLDSAKKTNNINDLDNDQIVIGQIYDGLEVIDKINDMIIPFAGRSYPLFSIGKCGIIKKSTSVRTRPGIKNYRIASVSF